MLATATAAASPVDLYALYVARFGVPVVGQRVFVAAHSYKNGFLSPQHWVSAIVAAP